MGSVIGEDIQGLDYAERLERLMVHRVGLWDVVAKATRQGSLDQAIRDAGHNPLADFFAGFPDLEAVAFNGGTAATAVRKLLAGLPLTLIDLPSSSPANTGPFEEKARAWSALAHYCGL